MALSKTTQDHDEIQQWAEKRGAIPAEVASTHTNNEAGILRFMFPKAKNHNDSSLREISWDEFFEKFDENGLELVYQEVTAEGAESNFNKLVHPSEDEHSSRKSKSSGSHSASSKSSRSAANASGQTAKASGGRSKEASAAKSSGKSSGKSSAKGSSASHRTSTSESSGKAKGGSNKSSGSQTESSGSSKSAA